MCIVVGWAKVGGGGGYRIFSGRNDRRQFTNFSVRDHRPHTEVICYARWPGIGIGFFCVSKQIHDIMAERVPNQIVKPFTLKIKNITGYYISFVM